MIEARFCIFRIKSQEYRARAMDVEEREALLKEDVARLRKDVEVMNVSAFRKKQPRALHFPSLV